MIINTANLALVFAGFKTVFQEAFDGAVSHYMTVAMEVPSGTAKEEYGWLGQFPKLREWIGDRVITNLAAHGFTITNRKFENTIAISRTAMEDDQYGVYRPFFAEMGRVTRQHPDELVFGLLKDGFTKVCYDGQYFFDTDHPVMPDENNTLSVSNMQAGAGEPWFLLDLSRAVRPIVWQTRIPYTFTGLDKEGDENVFMHDEYIYGVRARANAGYALWQLAYASKADLTPANFEAALAAMTSLTGDYGHKLGIRPTHLVTGTANEGKARRLLNRGDRIEEYTINTTTTPVAVSNEWSGAVDLIVTSHLD